MNKIGNGNHEFLFFLFFFVFGYDLVSEVKRIGEPLGKFRC